MRRARMRFPRELHTRDPCHSERNECITKNRIIDYLLIQKYVLTLQREISRGDG